jgi:hypothetical protein
LSVRSFALWRANGEGHDGSGGKIASTMITGTNSSRPEISPI